MRRGRGEGKRGGEGSSKRRVGERRGRRKRVARRM